MAELSRMTHSPSRAGSVLGIRRELCLILWVAYFLSATATHPTPSSQPHVRISSARSLINEAEDKPRSCSCDLGRQPSMWVDTSEHATEHHPQSGARLVALAEECKLANLLAKYQRRNDTKSRDAVLAPLESQQRLLLLFGDSVDGSIKHFWCEHVRARGGRVENHPDERKQDKDGFNYCSTYTGLSIGHFFNNGASGQGPYNKDHVGNYTIRLSAAREAFLAKFGREPDLVLAQSSKWWNCVPQMT
jgi:hypothetical protein